MARYDYPRDSDRRELTDDDIEALLSGRTGIPERFMESVLGMNAAANLYAHSNGRVTGAGGMPISQTSAPAQRSTQVAPPAQGGDGGGGGGGGGGAGMLGTAMSAYKTYLSLKGGAAAGTLTFMVGATPELFATLQPVLAQMGRNIVHCGEVGTGQIAKICNNLLLAISMVGVSEAMALGDALGIDTTVLAGIINSSTGRCWSSEMYNPWPGIVETAPASRGYTGGFGAELMLKDLGLATEAARQAHQPVVLGAVAQQLYQAMSQRGEGGKDFSAIINSYRKPQ